MSMTWRPSRIRRLMRNPVKNRWSWQPLRMFHWWIYINILASWYLRVIAWYLQSVNLIYLPACSIYYWNFVCLGYVKYNRSLQCYVFLINFDRCIFNLLLRFLHWSKEAPLCVISSACISLNSPCLVLLLYLRLDYPSPLDYHSLWTFFNLFPYYYYLELLCPLD